MKKKFPKIIYLLLIIAAIFIGKYIIDQRTYQFKEEVNTNLTNYFIEGQQDGLTQMTNLLEKYKHNEKKRTEIQNYAYSIVGSWFTYLDDKYICNNNNLNSCQVQLDEFKNLTDKLVQINNYKSKSGFTIILSNYYSSLKSQADKKISDLEAIVKASNSVNPKNSEEIRVEKCQKSTDCENCRDGVCRCYYTSDGLREEITCNK